MAAITRENVGVLTEKITVTVSQNDYQPNFEKHLKQYAKSANIPGFRKGLVPVGLIRKMYGSTVFQEEVIKAVDKELNTYLNNEKLDIFAQPLPLENNITALDFNNPSAYTFSFEIGLKPSFEIQLNNVKLTKYNIEVTDEMVASEIDRLQTRFGTMTEPESISNDEQVLNVTFTELDAQGNVPENGINKANSILVKYFTDTYKTQLMGLQKDAVIDIHLATAFLDAEKQAIAADLGLDVNDATSIDKKFKLTITKIGFVEKAALDEAFFANAYPAKSIQSEEELKEAVKEDIAAYFAVQSRNQLHDQIFHFLVDNTPMQFPEDFLKRWLQMGGEKPKTPAEAEAELPNFIQSLKWTLISNQLAQENNIQALPEDIRNVAKAQLLQYMGGQMQMLGDDNQWMEDYANRMMQDKKFVEDSYQRIMMDKLFSLLETRIQVDETPISASDFASKTHHHHH